jgi:hypothetical protein
LHTERTSNKIKKKPKLGFFEIKKSHASKDIIKKVQREARQDGA